MTSGTLRRVRSSLIFTADCFSIVAIFSIVFFYRIGRCPEYDSSELWLISITFLLVLLVTGTYFRERSQALPRLPIRTFWMCLVAGGVCVGWVYILGPAKFTLYFGRGILPAGTLLCGVLTTLNRYLVNRLHHLQEKSNAIAYLGYSDHAESFISELHGHAEVQSITFAGPLPDQRIDNKIRRSNKPLSSLIESRPWQLVVVDPTFQASAQDTDLLVKQRLAGTPVVTLADFYEFFWYMIPVTGIDQNWFLRSQGFSVLENPISRRIKRTLDIVVAFLLLVITVPLTLVCAVLIKISSPGPVFYRQTRVGLEGKSFTIVKLRTMISDAEQQGAQWADKSDPRVTRVGRLLRATRLDEIPQCWNVLRGEMSFIGPRPERPEFTQKLSESIPFYDLRHLVKPGITGWAQVMFPYGASVEDALRKFQYELYYIKNQSLILDLNILLRTLITVFQRSGR